MKNSYMLTCIYANSIIYVGSIEKTSRIFSASKASKSKSGRNPDQFFYF
jgi:hypothetical protein